MSGARTLTSKRNMEFKGRYAQNGASSFGNVSCGVASDRTAAPRQVMLILTIVNGADTQHTRLTGELTPHYFFVYFMLDVTAALGGGLCTFF